MKHGSWIQDGIHFYDFTIGEPRGGMLNIPYVRDLTHLQILDAGGRDAAKRSSHHLRKMRPRARAMDAFLTMSPEFADQIRTELGIGVPHGLFRCYPTGARQTAPRRRRREFVYLDNQSIAPNGFELHIKGLARIARATGLPALFVSRRMAPEAQAILQRRRYQNVRVLALSDYDHRSAFGLLQNVSDFNQASVALNRKLLMYLACGMCPVIHKSFVASIRYVQGMRIKPLVFGQPKDIAAQIDEHSFGKWNPGDFDMDARIPDLLAELKRLGTALKRGRRGKGRGRGPTPDQIAEAQKEPALPRLEEPRVAICMPVAVSGASLVARTVAALAAQTAAPDTFEVVVAVDGGDDGSVRAAVRPDSWPFRCQVVDSPRTGGDVPHRNHARNIAWQTATAPICWMLDSDMLLMPTAIAHLIAEYDASVARGLPAVLSPVMRSPKTTPRDWMSRTADWMSTGDVAKLSELLEVVPKVSDVYDGRAEDYSPGSPASISIEPAEGMPAIPRRLLVALGGFDERYLGWGGNKEEMVTRLNGLRAKGLIDIRLLTSTMALHQPHARASKTVRAASGRDNQKRREKLARDVKDDRPWWRAEVDRVSAACDLVRRGVDEPIRVSLASIPSRVGALENVVASLIRQADEVSVYLNGYDDVPKFLLRPRVTVVRSQDAGDVGDRGKFHWCHWTTGYHIICDDDLDYPSNYVSRLIAGIDYYGRKAIIGVHGATLRLPCSRYMQDRTVIHFRDALGRDKPVHVLGTGTVAFHASAIEIDPDTFPSSNMADIWLAIAAQKQEVPMIALARTADWLKVLTGTQSGTIYDKAKNLKGADCPQTTVISGVDWNLRGASAAPVARVVRPPDTGPQPRDTDMVAAVLAAVPVRFGGDHPIVVYGRASSHVATALRGRAKNVIDAADLSDIESSSAAVVVMSDVLGRLDDTALMRVLYHASRACIGRGRLIAVEVTKLGNPRLTHIGGVKVRAPIEYQRLMRGLNVVGQRRVGDLAFTLFNGRLPHH